MKGKKGFTLVEVLVAVLILAAVGTIAYGVLARSQKAFRVQRDLVEAQQNARMAMETITSDLRQISFRKDATQASVLHAGVDSIVFVADLYDTIPGAELVSLYLTSDLDSATPNPSDRTIHRAVWDTSGVEVIRGPVAYGVADSGLTFHYYDRDGDPMFQPIVQPEHISEVEVAVTAQTAHHEENIGFRDVTVTTTVYPRNLPFTPPMPKPNPPGCGALSSPNCASLTISWTRPTENTDGSELAFNDISHFSVYYGTHADSMKLDTRLARNVDTWTVKNLTAGKSYVIRVTCTSVAGVESQPCSRQGNVGSSAPPKAPGNFAGSGAIGAVDLSWAAVTEDTMDNQITAQVTYSVYRSDSPGVTPSGMNLLVSGLLDTTYTDPIMDSCAVYYYCATASACGLEGGSSIEALVSLPPPPSCPVSVSAAEGENAGEVVVGWVSPSTRTDGSSLGPSEISRHRIYYSLIPSIYTDSVTVGAGVSSHTLTGLQDCSTYYVNAAALDNCGTRGTVCPGREAAARTSAPCNEYVPEAPSMLALDAGDQSMDLTWAANQVDCDLDGYRIYYGTSSGVYNGTGADQGSSPVFVGAAAAHADTATARYSLTGLEHCTEYFIVVAAVDVCEPPHESTLSPEDHEITICGTCDITKECVTEIAEGSSQERVRFQIGNEGSTDLTVEEIEFAWDSGALLEEVIFAGSPVWHRSGSAGEGPVGAQPSPADIDVDDFGVTTDDDFGHPVDMVLVFDGSAVGDMIGATFSTAEGVCTIHLSPCERLFSDDFAQPNGSPQGWTPRTGSTWYVSSNVLRTTSDGRITPDALGFSLGDYTAQVRAKMTGYSYYRRAGIYVRYRDTGNYYLLRFYPALDLVEFRKKVNYGGLDLLGYTYDFNLNSTDFFTLKVSAYGNTFRCWLNGQLIDWAGATGTVITDSSIDTGNISMYAWDGGTGYFDDVLVEPTCGCGGVVP